MAKTNNVSVSVLDTLDNKIILKGVTMKEAAEKLGVSYKYVANTVYSKGLIQRRYKVFVVGYMIKTIIPDVYEEKVSEADKFKNDWDTCRIKLIKQVGQDQLKNIKITCSGQIEQNKPW